ncbi:MAG: ubiquitin-like domain-containing protein [Oscillospiraceae bacterium]|nr:ubiquitin-like domain-containing protein [Oscillospiraceae bacterium]
MENSKREFSADDAALLGRNALAPAPDEPRTDGAAEAAENAGAGEQAQSVSPCGGTDQSACDPSPAGGRAEGAFDANIQKKKRAVRFRASDAKKKQSPLLRFFLALWIDRLIPFWERSILPPWREKALPFIKKIFPPRAAAAVVLLALYALPVGFLSAGDTVVVVREDGRDAGVVLSAAADAVQIAADCGLSLRDEDIVSLHTADAVFGAVQTLEIVRAFPVRVSADGATAELYTAGDTVAAVLARAGIELGADDFVEPAADTVLSAESDVVVRRVTYDVRTVEETAPAQTVLKPSPLLSDGVKKTVTTLTRDGAACTTYRDRYVDGLFDGTELLYTAYTKYPWNAVTLVGQGGIAASSLDGSKYTDAQIVDGVPSAYESVKAAQPCTAYSFKPGVWGSSGMFLVQGMVAVNPEEYAYGDLLYITSADGSFVYGWAIAADSGTAMMSGAVEIDCFFETYGESVLFGKKWLDVYVVGHLTQGQLEEYAAQAGMFRARVPAD